MDTEIANWPDVAISLGLQDREGRPLDGATVTVSVVRPTTTDHDFTIPLRLSEPGLYSAQASFPLKGQWELRTLVVHPDGRLSFAERVVLK